MNKEKIIKNTEIFQGEKYLKTNKEYFEGWYFKNIGNKNISFIPGININENEKKSFIQIITNKKSYFIDYGIDDFKFNHNPFYIKIGNSLFSKERIYIDINDKKQKLKINGDITYSNNINIKTNIMGPFVYIPFMECNHGVICMKNKANGLIKINNKRIKFNNGIGYIEKDWGTSFPKNYIWCQGNNFKNKDASFMLAIANIPFKFFNFKGVICSLIINGKEYRFATYNNTKIIKYDIKNNSINISLKKGKYILNIKSKQLNGHKLSAPIKGKMSKDILESITSVVNVTLKENNNVIFSDTSTNCGLEIIDK